MHMCTRTVKKKMHMCSHAYRKNPVSVCSRLRKDAPLTTIGGGAVQHAVGVKGLL